MGPVPAPIDSVDEQILAELTRDGRQSVTALAQRVHISRAHAYARINRLQQDGVITRYSAVVDPVRAGLRSSAYVTLKLRQHGWREVREALAKIPEVYHVSLVGGNFDVLLLVRARDNLDLRRVVFDHIQPLPAVLDTQTFVIFEDADTR
ncbi:Lrp/AsnC family transcriptional regulator [Citricoccus parietis]|uniref:Lrp/AsnC family transcriptional regulator n=2 Tax=Citricoccus parietis TaxID=592307 RepID=A0ABV6F2V4_9MICC